MYRFLFFSILSWDSKALPLRLYIVHKADKNTFNHDDDDLVNVLRSFHLNLKRPLSTLLIASNFDHRAPFFVTSQLIEDLFFFSTGWSPKISICFKFSKSLFEKQITGPQRYLQHVLLSRKYKQLTSWSCWAIHERKWFRFSFVQRLANSIESFDSISNKTWFKMYAKLFKWNILFRGNWFKEFSFARKDLKR